MIPSGQDTPSDPWWASGRPPQDGLDGSEDPFDAHRQARRGAAEDVAGQAAHDDAEDVGGPGAGGPGEAGRLATEAMDLVARLVAEAGRRVSARATANASWPPPGAFTRPDPTGPGAGAREDGGDRWAHGMPPHEDGQVCDACPVCIGLRALRQVRPEVVGHLSDAAHHVSLALRAFADAQAEDPDDLEKIDLDP